jgi:hypothetical protein
MNEMQEYSQPAPKGQIRLAPGDIVYEYLVKNDPKKLKRMMKEEMAYFQETHAPGYEKRYTDELAEARIHSEQRKKKSTDYRLLGLDQINGPILKKDVRNAYRRQTRKLHPDVGGSNEAFNALHEAYRRVLASVPKE